MPEIKVGIFYNSFKNPHEFTNKRDLMDDFKSGVLSQNNTVVQYHDKMCEIDKNLKFGFILGYTLQNNYRKHIVTTLENHNIHRIYVDSNILNYAYPANEWHRYSLNSVYPDSGIYTFGDLDKSKWHTFSKFHNVKLEDWRTTGNHILILCQRTAGWNMLGNNQLTWVTKTITKLRKHSDRPIVIRMHPGDGQKKLLSQEFKKLFPDVTISINENIRQDLKDCWCTVGYNSTPNVVSIIEGIPNILHDPIHSWAADVSGTMLNSIESPIMPDREEWIHRIANIHWSNDEVKTGKLWSQIRDYTSSVQL